MSDNAEYRQASRCGDRVGLELGIDGEGWQLVPLNKTTTSRPRLETSSSLGRSSSTPILPRSHRCGLCSEHLVLLGSVGLLVFFHLGRTPQARLLIQSFHEKIRKVAEETDTFERFLIHGFMYGGTSSSVIDGLLRSLKADYLKKSLCKVQVEQMFE